MGILQDADDAIKQAQDKKALEEKAKADAEEQAKEAAKKELEREQERKQEGMI